MGTPIRQPSPISLSRCHKTHREILDTLAAVQSVKPLSWDIRKAMVDTGQAAGHSGGSVGVAPEVYGRETAVALAKGSRISDQ